MMTAHYKFQYRQSGVSLLVVLILLVIVTILGLASLRNTLLQERMSANLLDRGISFQAAERALREGQLAVAGGAQGRDCTVAANACPTPDETGAIAGCSNCWINAAAPVSGDNAPGTPQYYIQRMRLVAVAASGAGQDASQLNYGESNTRSTPKTYFRIYARSHDPDVRGGRAVVVLQSTVVRQ